MQVAESASDMQMFLRNLKAEVLEFIEILFKVKK
jgi:hypothetical protein